MPDRIRRPALAGPSQTQSSPSAATTPTQAPSAAPQQSQTPASETPTLDTAAQEIRSAQAGDTPAAGQDEQAAYGAKLKAECTAAFTKAQADLEAGRAIWKKALPDLKAKGVQPSLIHGATAVEAVGQPLHDALGKALRNLTMMVYGFDMHHHIEWHAGYYKSAAEQALALANDPKDDIALTLLDSAVLQMAVKLPPGVQGFAAPLGPHLQSHRAAVTSASLLVSVGCRGQRKANQGRLRDLITTKLV